MDAWDDEDMERADLISRIILAAWVAFGLALIAVPIFTAGLG